MVANVKHKVTAGAALAWIVVIAVTAGAGGLATYLVQLFLR
jgi:hypothetical protein